MYEDTILTNDETKVVDVLVEWSQPTHDGFDGRWYGYNKLSNKTRIPIKKLKVILKNLRKANIIELEPTYSTEGILSGSGYFIRES